MDLLVDLYPWIKSFHVVAVTAWMAGLFYLPRLFVYHAEAVTAGGEADRLFQTMEGKLYRLIMVPSMILTWVLGLCLVAVPGVVDWGIAWPWVKATSVLAMTAFHVWLGARKADFALGRNVLTGRRYRMMNEVPTLLLVTIVVAVIVKF